MISIPGIIFWTFSISSLVISVIGLINKKPVFLLIGALLAVPSSLYMGMTPLFKYWGIALPLFQVGAAVAIKRKVSWLSWLLVLPYTTLVIWLAIQL